MTTVLKGKHDANHTYVGFFHVGMRHPRTIAGRPWPRVCAMEAWPCVVCDVCGGSGIAWFPRDRLLLLFPRMDALKWQ